MAELVVSGHLSAGERRLRWFIVGWITLSTILNLIDRNTLAILAPTFSAQFSGSSFTNSSSLIEKLRSSFDPVSRYLWDRFSAQSQKVLTDPNSTSRQQQDALIGGGDNVLRGPSIYDAQRFAGVTLSEKTLTRKSQNPRDQKDLIRLNRLLLEDAYPREIRKSVFLMTERDYSNIINAFLLAYTVMYTVAGRFVDKVGEKIGMTACILWWSISTMLHALARGALSLGILRFLLGIGEPGNYPAALRVCTNWFAKAERGLPIAIFSSGSSVGSLLAVPMISFLTLYFGWRAAFFVPGFLGLIWVLVWALVYRLPPQAADGPGVAAESPRVAETKRPAVESMMDLLRDRNVRAIVLARFVSDPVWVFYLYWTPKYLASVWGFNLKDIGLYAWIPFLFGGMGGVFGGAASDWLIRRGLEPARARKCLLYCAGAVAPLGMTIGFAGSSAIALALIAIMAFVVYIWYIDTAALISDVFPGRVVGSILGLMGTAGSLGGIGLNWFAGFVLDTFHSYTPIFVVAGSGHLAASLILFFFLKERRAEDPDRLSEVGR
jgi:ACS family hexuronate transporter-like MFS transporter